jgi:hypothetical protein
MTGGLIQMVISGKQDVYLTINPEITFFKKVYRRHTNFSTELKEILPEFSPEYNNIVSFIINNGDAVHRCYLEIELPLLSFSDKYITNNAYKIRKQDMLTNINTNINLWNDSYINLKNYIDIELQLYRVLYNYLQIENITINTLKDEVTTFNFINKTQKDNYKNKIDDAIYISINISGYISSITKLLSNIDNSIYISRTTILNNLNQMYQKMLTHLSYYNLKLNEYKNQYTEQNKDNIINFNYAEYLGHNYFQYFTLEIGGLEIQKYTNDILHINQMHRIKQNEMPNYLEMIGHVDSLNTFNNSPKGNTKILVPLIFWFNKDSGSSLPLVALQYSSIIVNAYINNISNIISFRNYEKMYDDIVNIEISVDTYILNINLIYNSYKINNITQSITYNCLFINAELLKIKFLDLSESDINIILTNNGTLYTLNQISILLNPNLSLVDAQTLNGISGNDTQYLINKYQWFNFMLNINNTIYNICGPKISSYYYYIDYNLYYSLINNPQIKLIAEIIYLDDIEREKFADSKLEYIIEKFEQDIYNVPSQKLFDCELSFTNPCKELLWYIQPQIFYDGLANYGQNISLLFDNYKYFNNSTVNIQKLQFNGLDILLTDVDLNYYTYLLSYKYFNNILVDGVYYNSFCLYPEETQPSGTVNLRQIKGKQYHLEFNQDFLTEYYNFLLTIYKSSSLITSKNAFILKFIAKNYDLFVVHKGKASLLFNY